MVVAGVNADYVREMEMVLRQLQSPDNAARNSAEAAFNASKRQAGPCMVALSTLATGGEDESVKALAAVLLRRSAAELFKTADDQSKEVVKKHLFDGVRGEPQREARRRLCDSLSAIAGTGTDVVPVMQFLFQLANSSEARDRESALYMFAQLTDFCSEKMEENLNEFFNPFKQGLQDQDLFVEIDALRAVCSVLNNFEYGSCKNFGELIPLMMKPISDALNARDEINARLCLELLIESLETEPKCWRKFLPQVSQLMLQIASTEALEDGTRQLGMEFLVTAVEVLPNQCKKMGNFVQQVFPVALNMMLEVEDDPDWYERDDDDDDDDYSNNDQGQEALDRFALKLGGGSILPVADKIIPQFLGNTESWTHRHAALLAISQIGEGCQKEILENLKAVAGMALSHFQDPHPRVRWAAVHCIGQMCTDFAPHMQDNFHQEILPRLVAVMDDASQPRVQSHAAAAIINFCEHADAEIIQQYMDQLLLRLMNLLRSPRKLIQEQAVTAVASVADSAETKFQPYYQSFMPDLINMLQLSNGEKKMARLRGKVMECISIIGLAVGKEMFKPDSDNVMRLLVQTQLSEMDADDPQSYYMMQAYARICCCLKEDFIPYLDSVMPRLLEAASTQPEIEVFNALDDEDYDASNGTQTYVVGDKRISIKTSALEDKATACSMIACFVGELKGGFIRYVESVATLMVPLLKFYCQDDCRIAAAQCLPDLLVCVQSQGESFTEQYHKLLQYVIPELIQSIPSEAVLEVTNVKFKALADIIGTQKIQDQAVLQSCVGCILGVLKERIARQQEQEGDPDEDGEPYIDDEMEEAEEKLLDRISDLNNALCSSGGEAFIPIFEQADEETSLLEIFSRMLVEPKKGPANERRIALCIFDDIIEFGGQSATKYIETLLPQMLLFSADNDPDVKQAAAYGVGIAAEKGGEVFARLATGRVSAPFEAALRHAQARSETNEPATDNVVAAVAKILELHPSCFEDPNKFASAFLSYLPMKADISEALSAHERLVRFVEQGNATILGENFRNLGQILRVFTELLETELISQEYSMRVKQVLRSMQQQLPAETLQQASQVLGESHRAKLQAALM
mmetsp:Transcript_5010/g.15027  ORF Transcript_5010/g.15027 Transcript_5010/m.15027 type:complete len:1089 (+) Transcript_5010:98-3364(+)|eukprot:CAMPEP_0198734992 /NCGR_PEP_ID=MMETSP1475-20131203/56489_1 /TAXON_ID= ORGANISM="Unidentified sp., Strain CCMP1999" /NCGR_SAMPLE_ID=MMETSP1475 /ASSEMBLY_ACC=CAM_ASM_001111 /LENGTH=1088 /DNA_ID=CAMNT_0044498577 /DNA_START=8 /DNA_END=3274 /DNA_ORIENTATION=-